MAMLTRKEAMHAAGLSWQAFRREVRSGRLPYAVRGGRRMYRAKDLPHRKGSR
jgi:hypothetical protein